MTAKVYQFPTYERRLQVDKERWELVKLSGYDSQVMRWYHEMQQVYSKPNVNRSALRTFDWTEEMENNTK